MFIKYLVTLVLLLVIPVSGVYAGQATTFGSSDCSGKVYQKEQDENGKQALYRCESGSWQYVRHLGTRVAAVSFQFQSEENLGVPITVNLLDRDVTPLNSLQTFGYGGQPMFDVGYRTEVTTTVLDDLVILEIEGSYMGMPSGRKKGEPESRVMRPMIDFMDRKALKAGEPVEISIGDAGREKALPMKVTVELISIWD